MYATNFAANPYIRALGLNGLGDWLTDGIEADDASQDSSSSFFSDPIFGPSSSAPISPSFPVPSSPSSSGFSLDNIFGDITKIVGTGAQLYQTKTLLDINAERAKQGLPPISASAIAPTVNFGLDPAMMPYLMIGGAALLLIIAMGDKKK